LVRGSLLCFALLVLGAQVLPSRVLAVDISPPTPELAEPISARAESARTWQEGEYEVWLLHGDCELRQGKLVARCRDAVLWIDRAQPLVDEPSHVIAYLETDVWMHEVGESRVGQAPRPLTEMNFGKSWLGRFNTTGPVQVDTDGAMTELGDRPPVYARGVEALGWHARNAVQTAQFTQSPTPGFERLPAPVPSGEVLPNPAATMTLPTARQVSIIPRSSQLQTYPGSTPNETIVAITGGVRVVVSGIEGLPDPAGVPILPTGVVMIEADRVVAWTDAAAFNIAGGEGAGGAGSGRWEIYLEGNIVFREGERVIYADRLYYQVNEDRGTILSAEMLTAVPGYEGLLRLKADVIEQLDAQNFQAHGAALTSSRLGVPRYWLQSENMTLQLQERVERDLLTGQPLVDTQTGDVATDTSVMVTSRNNFIYLGGVPIFYWPVAVTDATKPTFYVDRVRLNNDNVFGSQVFVQWDTYQVFGIRPIDGTRWSFSTDYLSERGPAAGTQFTYNRDQFLFHTGETYGRFDAWGIEEEGLDNLGSDRRTLFPEADPRGRVLWLHRQKFPTGWQFTAEAGLISDRNFLEQYYEREWDENKDQSTGIELKHFNQNATWSITADARLNDFFTQTERLPRFDHFLVGQSVFGTLTWHGHSLVGYEKLRTAVAPSPINPSEVAKFNPLAWEKFDPMNPLDQTREGLRAATRQEFDWPIQLGSLKVVPYVLGEAAHWSEDLDGNEVTRYYGQTGVRASIPLWRADPMVQNTLFNLNGLAHKIVLDGEYAYADAEENLDVFPLYDPVDDDANEHFRRRLYFNTFGGPAVLGLPNTPIQFDERYFAFRSGMQSWVTAPSLEIVDDLTYARVGVRQRWQTKRGLPGQERIVDWIVLDVEGTYFPEADRDNFGADVGLANYDFRWHVGDRLTLLSDGFADFFGQGLRTFSAGATISRPERGNAYLGFRSLEGPISGNILVGSFSYRMTEKWIATGGASFDFGNTGTIGQSFHLTRVGESALVRVGFNYDASRDNFGINLAIEPRFLPSARLGQVGGVTIPPAGAYGLE
jgi:hypothetical protein